ncbi:MAG TPA: hypothetical protein VGE02_13470 [Gemmatimonadales bacterium]
MSRAGAALVAPLALLAGVAAAQPSPLELEAGVAITSPLLVDGNGTRVRLSPAPLVGISLAPASWRAGRVAGGVTARISTATVRLEDDGARWSGGRAWQGELLATATLSRRVRVTPHAGAGVAWLGGDADVAVVRDVGRRPRALVEGGVELRRAAGSRTALSLVAQGYRITPAGGDAGGVLRVLLALRHAW